MKKTTTMTSGDPAERQAAMAARVHRLSDPLAAMGQRSPAERLRRERHARLVLLAITLSATLVITGAIAAIADPPSGGDNVAYQTLSGRSGEVVHIRSSSS